MSWTHLEDKEVTARKPHKCYLCGRPIEKKQKYLRRVGIDDDAGFVTVKMHKPCEAATKTWEQEDWETYDEVDFRELLIEQCQTTDA
jgi:hypothetical protein